MRPNPVPEGVPGPRTLGKAGREHESHGREVKRAGAKAQRRNLGLEPRPRQFGSAPKHSCDEHPVQFIREERAEGRQSEQSAGQDEWIRRPF